MPGRQIILYDKRREVIDRRKTIWWDIWNANLARDGLPPLNPRTARKARSGGSRCAAGKDHLKDRWQIRQWAEFDALFGDVVARTLAQVRYSQPDPTDSNRARWPNHPIWDMAAAECEGDLTEMRSHVDPDSVRYVHRAEHIRLIMAQLTGNATTLAALEGVPEPELSDHMERLGARLADAIRADPERAANKLTEAKARYRFTE